MVKISYNVFITENFTNGKIPEFHVKTSEYLEGIYWEYSCGCFSFVTRRLAHLSSDFLWEIEEHLGADNYFPEITEEMWESYKCLGQTDHILCPEDPKLIERLSAIWDIPHLPPRSSNRSTALSCQQQRIGTMA